MADDKATMEAVNNIAAMFPGVDKETITDIYLGCKKDLDQTIDQLIGMGAEQEEQKPIPFPIPVPTAPVVPVSPKLVDPSFDVPAPNVAPLQDATVLTESPAEKARLELLNQQLSMEYRRLADTQEKNIQISRQLEATKATIAMEQSRLAEERQKLEEQQTAFLADKKRLEEHLASRLKEMKEQMRVNEELTRAQEEEARSRLEAERRREQEEARLVEQEKTWVKEQEAEAKLKRKELKDQKRAQEEQIVQELRAEVTQLQSMVAQYESRLDCNRDNEHDLRVQIEDLTEQLRVVTTSEAQRKTDSLDNLKSVVSWLHYGLNGLPSNVTSDKIREELHKSLGHAL